MSSVLSVRIPKSLHNQLKELAQQEGVSVDQFVMLAVAEKVATLQTVDYLWYLPSRPIPLLEKLPTTGYRVGGHSNNDKRHNRLSAVKL
jgi:hypothetical protein